MQISKNHVWQLSTLILIGVCHPLFSQQDEVKLQGTAFEKAEIIWQNQAPRDIRLSTSDLIPRQQFFNKYKKAFALSDDNVFEPKHSISGQSGLNHTRYQQFYRGIEVAETQYILHAKNERVSHANGNAVHGLEMSVSPSLSIEQAAIYVKKHFPDYELPLNTGYSFEQKKTKSLPLPVVNPPRLIISSGSKKRIAENFRLAYRFDVITYQPLSRYDVDIDAHTGELIGKIPRIYDDNIHTKGISLYNDTVDIVIIDSLSLSEWDYTYWHLDDWSAYGGSGVSWWPSDTLLGNNGGYADAWYDVLETDNVQIVGDLPRLSFYHRYSTEPPQIYGEFDAWDGMNVQISSDNGTSWSVLENPIPSYDRNSLFSFDFHGEGPGIPGWCGEQTEWTAVSVSLSGYVGETVKIRFVFVSDGAASTGSDDPDWFGWQVDEIKIANADSNLYYNPGDDQTARSFVLGSAFVGEGPGKYRLRETTRGKGIATYNGATMVQDYGDALDFAEEDTFFSEPQNAVGVGVHWALEQTYDYYLDNFEWKSYDNLDSRVQVYAGVEFEDNPVNAYYAGGGFMFYGTGDGTFYGPVSSLDVVGHEFTHGVTASSANLVYQYESGALNESFSDIFGETIEYHVTSGENDWLMGADFALLGPPFRSMSNPQIYGQPDTYQGINWVPTDGSVESDNGGVHTNSGVQNYWYYLVSEGGSGTNDDDYVYSVDPIGTEDAERIAFNTLTAYLIPTSGYYDAAQYSIQSAIDLFGDESQQKQTVVDAWNAVGVYQIPKIDVPGEFAIKAYVGSTVTSRFTIKNIGVAALEIGDLQIEGDGFTLADTPDLPFAIDTQSDIRIAFTPSSGEAANGTLTISSNDPSSPVVEVNLSGEGIITDLNNQLLDEETILQEVYPNPAQDNVSILIYLPVSNDMNITILDTRGRVVKKLAESTYVQGEHLISWDLRNDAGKPVSEGSYLIQLEINNTRIVKSLIVL